MSSGLKSVQIEEILVFGYIRRFHISISQHVPDSIIQLICYRFFFQEIGTFLIIFESSPIISCDISNQWQYISSSKRNQSLKNMKTFRKSYETSFCLINSIKDQDIPGLKSKSNMAFNNVIYRVGGLYTQSNIGCILGTDILFNLPTLNKSRYGNRTVYSKQYGLLTISGCAVGTRSYLNSIEQLMYNNDKWYWNDTTIAHMITARFCSSTIIVNNGKYDEKLFVIGGKQNAFDDLNTAEMYSFKSKKWININSMKYYRNSAGICEWKENNGIIIGGGYNGNSCRSVEQYDLHKDKWYPLPNTNSDHKNCCSLKIYYDVNPFFKSNNGVIVMFGNDGTVVDASQWGDIEYYDNRDWVQKWTTIQSIDSCLLNSTQNQKLFNSKSSGGYFLWTL